MSNNPYCYSSRQSAIVLQHLDFVLDKTEEYSRTVHGDTNSDLASEFICGCRCLSLLHKNPEWGRVLLERSEHNFIMRALKVQKKNEEGICQIVVQTILDALKTDPLLTIQWVARNDEDIATIVVDSIDRIHEKYSGPSVEKEGLLFQRLQLMEIFGENCLPEHHKAVRMYFNGTNAFDVLVNLWDDWRDKKYSNVLLGQIMRSMRTIYNERWVPRVEEVSR